MEHKTQPYKDLLLRGSGVFSHFKQHTKLTYPSIASLFWVGHFTLQLDHVLEV